jgi:hypothetical protein
MEGKFLIQLCHNLWAYLILWTSGDWLSLSWHYVCVCVCARAYNRPNKRKNTHFIQQKYIWQLQITGHYIFCSVCSVFIMPTGILRLPWLRFFRAFSSVVRQMPGHTSQRRGTVCTLHNYWNVLFYELFVLIVLFYVLFVCKCVLYYFHWVSTQLQLNIYHISYGLLFCITTINNRNCGGTAVKVLCYKSEGLWFNSRWCHWNFSLTKFFRSHYGPGVDSASNRNEYQEHLLGVKAAGA